MLLAIDTSTRTVGLALYDGAQVVSEMIWTSHDHHTAELAPAIADLMAKAGINAGNLQALAVALGPGSFTGLRIGLAVAKGLALVRHIPIVGIPTLDFLAAAQPVREVPLAAVLRAGRNRLAVGWYKAERGAWQATGEVVGMTAQELHDLIQAPTVVCGELTGEERRLLGRRRKIVLLASPAQSLRRPSFLAELGWRQWQMGKVSDPATLAPFYLHYNEPIPG